MEMNSLNRYDRQIRLWGEKGQISIENASVCVIGSSALASEILKGLVLPGIGRFCIIDNVAISEPDLGQNFFISTDDLGKSRAAIITKYLMELNPSVKGSYILHDVNIFSPELKVELLQYSIVIATNLIEPIAMQYSDFLFKNDIYFINARTFGMLGYLRLSFRQHVIYNIHSEHSPYDFQLDNTFDELNKMVESEDLETMSHEKHSHTPYLILYIKALEIWRTKKQEEQSSKKKTFFFPNNYESRKEFEKILMLMRKADDKGSFVEDNFEEAKKNILRSFNFQKIPQNVQKVFTDVKAGLLKKIAEDKTLQKNYELLNPFWVFAAAVQKFTKINDGRLPLSGNLPDMISDSERYIKLQKIYRQKAEKQAKQVFEFAKEIFEERFEFVHSLSLSKRFSSNRSLTERMDIDEEESKQKLRNDTQNISWIQCQEFCKNVSKISVQNGESLSFEYLKGYNSVLQKISHSYLNEQNFDNKKNLIVDPLVWYILFKAIDCFYTEKNRFPGTKKTLYSTDIEDMKQHVLHLITKTKENDLIENIDKTFPPQIFEEICRAGNAEIHVIAAILGGVTAQEAIKLITCQYLPLDNTLIYDGHSQNAVSFRI